MMILLGWIIALLGFLKVAASLLRRGQERRDGAGLIPEVELMGVAEKETSINNTPHSKYDVFVSFRGEDIRDNFLSHLAEAFSRKQINAFVDDQLKRGDDISHSLFEAIEGSLISLIIFSENYASSRWCLEELVKIIECKEKYKRIVIPVFYRIDPTVVRHQKTSYKNAFSKLKEKYNSSEVQIWRDSLRISANLSGITSSSYQNDAELLKEIINHVSMRLRKHHPVNSKGLVGIDKPVSYLESLLQKESKKIRIIGIWGMGGIGKSTIAKEIFSRNCSEYDGCCFLEKVSEKLTRHGGIESLKETLFSTVLKESVKELSSNIKRQIGRMKVLIVLDDVKDTEHLETLFGTLDWFRSDSRIILTTRDRQVHVANEVDDDDIFEVREMNRTKAFELFILNAFKQNHLENEFYDVSKRVVKYAKGIPLVLKVLAHMLRGKNKEVWESQLDKLKTLSVQKIHDVMRLGYDDLDRLEQKYFLDIACFFNGLSLKVDSMKLLLKDYESDNSVVVGLERLKDKALITISEDNVISMHDILQEMGREVARQESSEDPKKRSRLWDPDEICDVLTNHKGTDAIRSISLPTKKKLKLSPHLFDKMTNLQFLDFHGKHNQDCLDLLPQGLQSFPTDLRYLQWDYYPLKSLPEKFSAENLVILNLTESLLENLWYGVQDLVNLKEVRLTGSKFIKELPDFTKATNLKVLNIQRCSMLKSIHPSIFSLNELVQLDLLGCGSIIALPSSCFECQSKLEVLVLRATQIKSIPSSIKNLTRLRRLDIQFCLMLRALPELPSSVETLLVTCTKLKTVLLPSSVAEQFKENKKRVEFWNCLNLDERSLINIGLNLQINLMKFAYQHLSTPEHSYVESYGDYEDKLESREGLYVYPGNTVPEWLEYKTTTNDMIVDLSPPNLSPLLEFVFCFVFAKNIEMSRRIELNITTIEVEGDGEKDGLHITMYRPWMINSDHVCMIYDQPCSEYLTRIARNKTRGFTINVTATGTSYNNNKQEEERREMKLKGFGMSPINHSTYHNLIQQME